MELTFIGFIQIAVGSIIVLTGGLRSVFVFLVLSSLFDGSASVLLPALGGSSIPPVQFGLLFVFLRILMPGSGFAGAIPDAINANWWLVLFTVYGLASAYLAPRLFAGSINVYPMQPDAGRGLFYTVPLKPTSQNITAGVYLLGTLLLAVASYISCRFRGGASALVSTAIWAGWIHIATGILDVLTRDTPAEVILSIFRNGNYAQVDHEVAGFLRIRGLLPESSSYAGLGFSLFVLNAELWYRSIRNRATGLAAAALALVLFFSTSSTAYVALGSYMLFFLLRAFALPYTVGKGKMRQVAIITLISLFIVAVTMIAIPGLPQSISDMILEMTVEKSGSDSGEQRLFWAMQGWHGLVASYGLGIGSGSFRSSSMIMAILGSMGVIGIVTFSMYLLTVFQPWRRSTYGPGEDLPQSLGGAFGSSALLLLIPAAIAAPQPNPGTVFAILAGASLAMRPVVARRPRREDEERPERRTIRARPN